MACRCRQESKCPFREFEQLRLLLPSTSGIARTCIHKTPLVRREMSVLPTVFTNSEPARAFVYVFLMDKLLVYENASICWHNNVCMFMGTVFFSNKKMKITACNFKTVIRYQITYKLFHMLHIWYFLLVHFQNHCRGLIPQRLRQPWITSYYLVMAVITPGVVLDWTLGELHLNAFFLSNWNLCRGIGSRHLDHLHLQISVWGWS